ncbi:hypothetical protein J3Q64DRAFT_1723595 [Phycomyces blakesleeanus]
MDATRSTTPEEEASGSVENSMEETPKEDSQTTATAQTLSPSIISSHITLPTALPTFASTASTAATVATATSATTATTASAHIPAINSADTLFTASAPSHAATDSTVNSAETVESEQVRTGPVLIQHKQQNTTVTNELRRRIVVTSLNEDTTGEGGSMPTDASLPTSQEHDDTINGGGFYECNICFDTATYPVLTLCGHLFCWSCLGQWLNQQSRNPTCPVCKAGCDREKVIPIYGRGKEEKDPRNDPSIPTRPAGQRPPPLRDPNMPSHSFFGQPLRGRGFNTGNVAITAGVGFFPFGIAFNMPFNGSTAIHGQPHSNGFLSRLFLMIMSLFIVGLIFS